jgi:pimeloyl-ACP methyl ester carboxylesterase
VYNSIKNRARQAGKEPFYEKQHGGNPMIDPTRLIFIHGLQGNSQGVKATLLRGLFPGMLSPDFNGSLDMRMRVLYELLGDISGWTIVGSSFGGLMGALFTCRMPAQVRKLVLLAPALVWPDFANSPPDPVPVPTIVYHGSRDEILPLDIVRRLANQVFLNLEFHVVDDDHGLYRTVHALDWSKLLN